MNPLAWLISLIFPACGFPAAAGLPTPPLVDVAHIVRPASPNSTLAAPQGFTLPPDIVTSRYQVPPDRLFALIQQVAHAQARTYPAAVYPAQLQVHYVARSAVFNFPDLITVQVRQERSDSSGLILYSRSVYGQSDLGVNRRRVVAWIAALQAKLPPSREN